MNLENIEETKVPTPLVKVERSWLLLYILLNMLWYLYIHGFPSFCLSISGQGSSRKALRIYTIYKVSFSLILLQLYINEYLFVMIYNLRCVITKQTYHYNLFIFVSLCYLVVASLVAISTSFYSIAIQEMT